MGRQQGLNPVSPLDQTVFSCIEIFFGANIQSLVDTFQSIEVEMINDPFFQAIVMVNDRKCRTGNGINDFPFSAQTRDQSGFTAPHRSIKTDDVAFDSFFQKVNRLIDLIQMILKTHASKLRLSGMHYNKRYDHFFHRYTTVLKSISKMIGIVIEVVLINKILLFDGEDEPTVKMGGWQLNDFWVINFND